MQQSPLQHAHPARDAHAAFAEGHGDAAAVKVQMTAAEPERERADEAKRERGLDAGLSATKRSGLVGRRDRGSPRRVARDDAHLAARLPGAERRERRDHQREGEQRRSERTP